MKMYLLTQQTYTEGNFGDLELNCTITFGVFSTIELAIEAKSKVKENRFKAQFGSAIQQCYITELELDKFGSVQCIDPVLIEQLQDLKNESDLNGFENQGLE